VIFHTIVLKCISVSAMQESGLWLHPRVRLTPHTAAFTPIPTASAQIAENYCAIQAGRPVAPERVVDRGAGY